MKEKNYTLTIDIQVTKDDTPKAKKCYLYKIYSHPLSENLEPIKIKFSDLSNNYAQEIGYTLRDVVRGLTEKNRDYWNG